VTHNNGGGEAQFWPRSRKKAKHLLDIISAKNDYQETVERIKPLIPPENILCYRKKHARALINTAPGNPSRKYYYRTGGQKHRGLHRAWPLCTFARFLPNEYHGFCLPIMPLLILKIIELSAPPQKPPLKKMTGNNRRQAIQRSNGFGYIERGNLFKQINNEDIFRVKSIREKPDFQKAQEFVQSGNFY